MQQPSLQEQLRHISNTGASQVLLGGQMLGSSCVEELISSPALSRVSLLHIGGNYIGDQGVCSLVASPHVCELEELILLQNNLSARAARAIAASPNLHRLSKLNLCNNYLGDDGVLALLTPFAAPSWLERLMTWILGEPLVLERTSNVYDPYRRSHPGPDVAVPKITALGTLDWLDLGWNKITDEGLRALAASPLLRQLSYLNLQNNAATYEGLKSLTSSPHMHDFLTINASGNALSARDKHTLRDKLGERLRI